MSIVRHLAWLALAVVPSLRAQGVLVAPQGVFIDHRVRSGVIELYNPGSEAVDVSISTLFGFPVTDSLGRTTLKIVEQPDSTMPSAAAWIEAFPRRLTLKPLQRQIVRLLARPPAGLADGEYWTRLLISAKGGKVPVAGIVDTAAIRVGLTLEVRTIIAALYRKGPMKTGVALSNVRARLVGDSVEVRARLVRQGNAAFIGTVRGSVLDGSGRQVASFDAPVAVYYALEPRYTAAIGSLPRGRYRVRFEVATERDDVNRDALLRSATVRDSVEVQLSGRTP